MKGTLNFLTFCQKTFRNTYPIVLELQENEENIYSYIYQRRFCHKDNWVIENKLNKKSNIFDHPIL